MDELKTEIDDNVRPTSGIPAIWDRGRTGKELQDHHKFLAQGKNYWDELRSVLKVLFNQNRTDMTPNGEGWQYVIAFNLGYEKALKDVYKNIPRPKE